MINENNWNPVSEGLPNKEEVAENEGRFIVDNKFKRRQCFFDIRNGEFKRLIHISGSPCQVRAEGVIAWQPLPKPYKKKEVKNEESLGEIQPGEIAKIAGTDWIPLEHFKNGGTLCIRKDIWRYAAFDENNSNNWEISTLRKKLNTDFLMELCSQLEKHGLSTELIEIEQDLTADDGTTYGTCRDKVTLPTADQCRKYKPYLKQLGRNWYWLLTAYSTTNHYVRRVYADGTLGYNLADYGLIGVCPVCMFPSSIRVTE